MEQREKVLKFMKDYQKKNNFPATFSDIAEHFGWKSDNSAVYHVKRLEKDGLVIKTRGRGYMVAYSHDSQGNTGAEQ